MTGRFIRVPDDIADGTTDVAPQEALENWSNENNVFQFIRLEDLAYDRNDTNRVYIADTGRSRVVPDPETGRMVRGPSGTIGSADNGSIFVMELNDRNPRKVDAFYVLAQGDNEGAAAFVPMVSPDNVDTSYNSLMVQEDTARPPSGNTTSPRVSGQTWRPSSTQAENHPRSPGLPTGSAMGHGYSRCRPTAPGSTWRRSSTTRAQ